jgi:RNA polymerase sigma-70 factor, ECF subfamily
LGAPMSMEAAYKKYSAYVAYIGIRIIGRDDELDDLVQDVFIEAIKGLKTLRDAAAIKGWFATVTVRVATRRLRMQKLKRALGFAQVDHDAVWPGASPEQNAAISKVYRVLQGVTAKQRAAWILRVVEQEPLDQVAKTCGCSLATAKRWINEVQLVVAGPSDRKGLE